MESRARNQTVQGRRGLQRIIRDLHRDRHAAQRLIDAVEQRTREGEIEGEGEIGYHDLLCFGQGIVHHCDMYLEHLQRDLARNGEAAWLGPDHLQEIKGQRRELRRFLRYVPPALFRGVAVRQTEAERAEIAKVERRARPDTHELESALLLLRTDWLRAIRDRHDIRGHRARDRMAASIAEAIHHGDRLGDLLDETDGASWLKRYVEVVCAGGVALRSLSAVERRDLMVPLSWAQGAPGAGGRLRQLGLLFVGRDAGEAIAYVPSGARSAIAFSLAPHVRAQGVEGVSELLPVLEGLAVEERRRREREPSLPEHPYAWPGRVPTRLSRIRRKTPGPERVYELESCLRGSAEPVTRRILISYRRTVGALRQTMEVATSFRPHSSYVTSVGSGPAGEGYWFDPAKRGLTEGDRDEWATSIRDAFTNFGGRLVFHSCHGVRGGPPDFHEHEIRLVRVHAPERVGIEPRVVYGEGMAPYATAHGAGELQASIDAANILLERVSR